MRKRDVALEGKSDWTRNGCSGATHATQVLPAACVGDGTCYSTSRTFDLS